MSYVLKSINMTLDADSIANAVKEVELFQKRLQPAMQCLIEYLAEKGVEVARAELLFLDGDYDGGGENPAYATGALSESIRYRMTNDGDAVVSAGEGLKDGYSPPQSYAMYVEYGTGIYGADLNDHGLAGWWYPAPWGTRVAKDGTKLAWTNGMPPRPFMGHTLVDLEEEAKAAGARVIAEYLRGERA